MEATLLDEQGIMLTEVASHLGRSGQMVVDRASQPGALFSYYFERGGRMVTLVKDAERFSAVLETRWQMGVRFWFLHTFVAIGSAPRSRRGRSARDAAPMAPSIRSLLDKEAHATPVTTRVAEPRGAPS
jgi:hypothetical protein